METTEQKVIHSSFWANVFKSIPAKSDLEEYIRAAPLFSKLGRKDIGLLIGLMHNRSYLAGEYIFYQGDPGIGLYFIRDGEVLIKRIDNDNPITLANFHKGDFFGELALVDGEKRSASAVAKTECKLAVIFKPDLDEFIGKYPKKGLIILQGINSILATRLRKINEDHFALISKNNSTTEHEYGIQY